MTQSATTTTVRRQILVNAPIGEAFKVFTERFGDFKPREHNLLQAAIAETVFEPRVGGNIYDRAVDGSECRWARILAFEPPNRVVFSWDISSRWQIESNPDLTSEVEVRFFAETPERTRVELEHRNLDRHGSGWESVRDGVDNEAGWPLYLQRYAALFEVQSGGHESATTRRRSGRLMITNCSLLHTDSLLAPGQSRQGHGG
jgi:uncharacterized protein YndB with AHSA1/START domain